MTYISKLYTCKAFKLFMLLILFFSVFTLFIAPNFSKYAYQLFCILSLPLFFKYFKYFKNDVMFFLLIACLFTQVISWMGSVFFHSSISNELPKLDRLLKLFSFLFVAYWIGGSKKYTLFSFNLFIISFLLGIIFSPDLISDFQLALDSVRVDFGVKNAQYTSMLSGVSIILLVFNLTNLKFSLSSRLFFLNLIFLILLVFILVVSQSRQVWLALLFVIFILPITIYTFSFRLSYLKLFSVYFILLCAVFLVSKVETVEKRLSYTLNYEYKLFQNAFNEEKVKSAGNGIRINSWFDSFEWIQGNPLIGSGPNAISEVIKRSERLTEKVKKRIGHLHSFHLEILVAYGILGALVIYGMYYWLIRSLVLAHRENPELKVFTVLGICFLIFWIIINFFESFSSRSYGVYVHNIMFGCLYTFYFAQQRKKIEEAEACA